jgi:DNA-binding winged helix-turn-helix (wHTH) protein
MRLVVGDWVFDPDTREVIRRGSRVSLSPKAFALLDLLIRNRPKALARDVIREHLWPGIFVSASNLANLVTELRSALGDDARNPKIIRTVPRFGYAFQAGAVPSGHARGGPDSGAYVCRLVWGPREIALDPGENLIGRDRDSVVWIDDASVSRRHARIAVDADGATLEDLGSKNGTFLRGRRIEKPARLADLDAIKIGPASLVFRLFKRTGSTASAIEKREKRGRA